MSKSGRTICQIRVDLPLKSTYAYMFVNRSRPEWGLWWGQFFKFLLDFAPDKMEWRIHPNGNGWVFRPDLTKSQRFEIIRFIRTAPEGEIATHRTLKRAVALTSEQEQRLELMYFSDDAGECE